MSTAPDWTTKAPQVEQRIVLLHGDKEFPFQIEADVIFAYKVNGGSPGDYSEPGEAPFVEDVCAVEVQCMAIYLGRDLIHAAYIDDEERLLRWINETFDERGDADKIEAACIEDWIKGQD